MDISNFERLRVGSHYPQTLDIAYDTENGLKRAELRHKENTYGLFLFRYDDQELPEWWKDSEVVWSLQNNGVKDASK